MRIRGENGLREMAAAKLEVAPPPGAGAGASDEGPSPFARVLRGLGKEVDGGGKDLSSAELLALQAGVYRYSEAVDLSAKLIDRATSGIKTVLQGQ